MVLVPATMKLMGNANWWIPGWLDRLLPSVDIEGIGQHHDAPALGEIEEPLPVGSGSSAGP
jgi:RND superfamily putative drug exporter